MRWRSMRNLDQLVRFPAYLLFSHPIPYVSSLSVPLQPLAPPPLHRPTRNQFQRNPNLPHPLRRKTRNLKEISNHSSSDDLWRDVLRPMEIEWQARQSRRSHLVFVLRIGAKTIEFAVLSPCLLFSHALGFRVRLPFSNVIWTA